VSSRLFSASPSPRGSKARSRLVTAPEAITFPLWTHLCCQEWYCRSTLPHSGQIPIPGAESASRRQVVDKVTGFFDLNCIKSGKGRASTLVLKCKLEAAASAQGSP
jgi:hypothetical protein